jgi:hypothetical protein
VTTLALRNAGDWVKGDIEGASSVFGGTSRREEEALDGIVF